MSLADPRNSIKNKVPNYFYRPATKRPAERVMHVNHSLASYITRLARVLSLITFSLSLSFRSLISLARENLSFFGGSLGKKIPISSSLPRRFFKRLVTAFFSFQRLVYFHFDVFLIELKSRYFIDVPRRGFNLSSGVQFSRTLSDGFNFFFSFSM